nr:MAG TPA: protein of Unknown Function (DUF1540) [Caudoviricetes sp.]
MIEKKTQVRCYNTDCLNNHNGICSANRIKIGGTGRCKDYVAATHIMNTSKYGKPHV